jgi:hypothetical protein
MEAIVRADWWARMHMAAVVAAMALIGGVVAGLF